MDNSLLAVRDINHKNIVVESGKGEAVKTGDTANTVLWVMLVGISVSAMALTLRKRKVKR